MTTQYIVEHADGTVHYSNEPPSPGSGLSYFIDGGPTMGRVRVPTAEAAGTFFVNEGATFGRGKAEVAAPQNIDVPALLVDGAIASTAAVGSTLTCTAGNWAGEPTSYSYQWLRDAAQIGVGVNDTYLVATVDEGHAITCIVTATNAIGSTTAPPSNTVSVPAARAAARAPRSTSR